MSQTKALKVRLTLFCILVGIVLAMVAVVTDYWAVLSPHMEHHNATCDAAHFGLWRICTKRIVMSDNKDKSCGPITLPGGNVPTLCALSLPPALPRLPGKVARGKEGRSPSLGTGPLPSPLGRGRGSELHVVATAKEGICLWLFLSC